MRYLGIDYGSKKVGLALAPEGSSMAFPHSIIPNTSKLVEQVCALMAKEGVNAVVIGDSKDFQGRANPIAAAARALGDALAAHAGVPVFYEWEGLTSAEARRPHGKEEKTRAPHAAGDIDDSAAALILTSYLSHTNHGN
jgi:putative Holliday junction resolvase